ncbi:MAG: hypothetical protein NW205_10440 [Hyphomicrobiaceae bacterium]|nr:hypothetical protein [Hyphomicrobiaceae bacterium]
MNARSPVKGLSNDGSDGRAAGIGGAAAVDDGTGSAEGPSVELLVLIRIAAADGATRAELIRDLGSLAAHRLSPGECRELVTATADGLVAAGQASVSRGRYAANEAGRARADAFLGRKAATWPAWPEVRDGRLLATALGLSGLGPTRLKALARPDGLRALIVQKAFGLPLSAQQTTAKIRAQLAVVALERAFGNKIKTGLGAGSGFSAKAGRLLAGQLSSRPRDFGSDGGLIAALAAEAVDARQTDVDSLKAAVLRRFVNAALDAPTAAPVPAPGQLARPQLTAANDAGLPGAALAPSRRPDPATFARHVLAAAKPVAEGWGGNRKALISKVWQCVRARHPDWGLSEIEFKCMLAEAHRSGHLALASVDLKDARDSAELAQSAITYKNTVWHLVRVSDNDGR